MSDYSTARYYAISGIGYGKGHTPEEAVENYYEIQQRNFRHLHRTKPGRIKALKVDAPPTVFHAPEGVNGFILDSVVRWQMTDGTVVPASDDQRVDVPA